MCMVSLWYTNIATEKRTAKTRILIKISRIYLKIAYKKIDLHDLWKQYSDVNTVIQFRTLYRSKIIDKNPR